ncbi:MULTISPECIES: MarR family winged helix-turn-helix transcriptional regulator [Pseudomonas]|uniref:MarR family transcriptional regulator n=2 Tax=Pseudomonas chlororaphis group TaxID=136842 RepID=A0A7G7XAG0_9PSED|nr:MULTISPECIES: MarR family transcriptional regulator [Pseudomonas]RBJ82347.1 MarR family transcriptional regulator [Pseudomonas sp. MWU12-2534b]MCO7569081.1 MarR family transcriptional regulator [Pseudomonas chlororaphis]MCO7587074.1 MarR family transcriptional regulator [Pseudomonas chlororaphis]MDF2395978.1 MarR family transcriptional regulator [Pseudomonas sp. 3MA1]MDP9525949.1 MarR family transcriptional regulator [Pseudomonas protegens]
MNILENKHHIMLQALENISPDARESVRLCFELLSAAAAINRVCAVRLARYSLSEGRFVIMLTLKSAGGKLSPLELATRLSITTGTVTGLLDGLQGDGFIRRKPDPTDRRKLIISLTPEGRQVVDEVFADHTDWICSIIEGLSAEQRQALTEAIYCISASPALALQPPDGD